MTKTTTNVNDGGDVSFSSVTTDTLTSTSITVKELDSPTDSTIDVNAHLVPGTDALYQVGVPNFRWINSYVFDDRNLCGTTFTSPTQTIPAGFVQTKINVSIQISAYDAGSNTFKFPSKGFYVFSFHLDLDEGVATNDADISLLLSNAGQIQATHSFSSSSADMHLPYTITFGTWIDNFNTDRFQLVIKSVDGITNFTILYGRLFRCNAYV